MKRFEVSFFYGDTNIIEAVSMIEFDPIARTAIFDLGGRRLMLYSVVDVSEVKDDNDH